MRSRFTDAQPNPLTRPFSKCSPTLHQRQLPTDGSISRIWQASAESGASLPFYDAGVAAGFPSPADDHAELRLDLNAHLIANPTATFFVKVEGDSMRDGGISDEDLLVVDRSIERWQNRIVVAVLNAEFTLKRFTLKEGAVVLEAAHPDYAPIHVTPEMNFAVWGVAIKTIRKL